ncbi:MAG: Enterochelin esterase [Mucilaginibacter sp.]|nr:Enterochelin esterase [Mucilaginibacter sp.]
MKVKPYHILLLAALVILPAVIFAQTAQLTIKVIISPKVPKTDTLVVIGNQEIFGSWFDFTKGKMTRQDDTTWLLTHSFPVNTLLEFQITRGTYNRGAIFTNGRYQGPKVPFSIKKDTTLILRPLTWNDLFNRGATGNIKYYHNFDDHNLKYTRDVMVWLPPSYNRSPNKKYPVLYVHDGQNVFMPGSIYSGEWRLDEIADSLIKTGATEEFIIVAINNTKDRWVEYSGTPEGMNYLKFIVNNLKPFIDKNYRTKPDKNNTAIMGSSMGGLISFYMVWLYPNVFSKAACLSSGFAYDEGQLISKFAASSKKLPGTRLYLDCGDQDLDKYFLIDNEKMKALLNKHPEIQVMYKIFPGAAHNEYAWSKRLAIPLTFLFGKNETH